MTRSPLHRTRASTACTAAAAVAATLLTLAAPAHAHRSWGLEVALGLPWLQLQVGVPLPHGAVSVQVGGVHYRHHRGHWYRPWGARWILVVPPVGVGLGVDGPVHADWATSAADADPGSTPLLGAPAAPEPVVEPTRGQSPEQTETDRRDCNRQATTDAAAMADAGVFQRSVLACLRDRGYGVR